MVLGGPGAGKTWLAKRTARLCAEDALEALASGQTLDEVEVPLYTTCSGLYSGVGEIRVAAVSSALEELGDLGGSRLSAALRVFFTERNAPTVLVIDSLDEAPGSKKRLSQADTLPWRIILTSRPSSWNHQIDVKQENRFHQVGELQPLRYPDDVEPFIERWFASRPELGRDLAAQIARRRGLQEAATVPLILAFYCILGGNERLPEFRHRLYRDVITRMLAGPWRDGDRRQHNVDVWLSMLRAWAWPGASESHSTSSIGMWQDAVLTDGGGLQKSDTDALDHVATPLALPDFDTGKTLRRFVHRSIREHLVAERIASLPLQEAADVLLPHLWYDPDWEYPAAVALAMHPQRDRLLRDLICRVAGSDHMPGDLSVIDGGWQFREFLARVASESNESEWLAENAQILSRARLELTRSGRTSNLIVGVSWRVSNRQACDALIGLLAEKLQEWGDNDRAAERLVGEVVQLAQTPEDKRQACGGLLGLLTDRIRTRSARRLQDGSAHSRNGPNCPYSGGQAPRSRCAPPVARGPSRRPVCH